MYIELHQLFNQLERFTYPFEKDLKRIPENGIYIKFEKGEKVNDLDRITRVGTDRGQNQLHSRLLQHFENENQRRSIFRKHIGRSFLNSKNSDYLKFWDLDITSRLDKEKNLKLIDFDFENLIEKQISKYIKDNISFCVFELNTKEERLFWESKIIATLAQDCNVSPSENWLGKFSTNEKIGKYGLWQIQGLNKPKLERVELEKLKAIISKK